MNSYFFKILLIESKYQMNKTKVILIIAGTIGALFLAGVVICFTLLVELRESNTVAICRITPGECRDELIDDSIRATFAANISVDGCMPETIEMWRNDINCAEFAGLTLLTNGRGYYEISGFVCRLSAPCKWDQGAFVADIETPLMVVGILAVIGCVGMIILAIVGAGSRTYCGCGVLC